MLGLVEGGDPQPKDREKQMTDIDSLLEHDDGGDVGLGSEDKKHARSNQLEWFKGEKGRVYKIAFLYFNPLDASIVKAMQARAAKEGKKVTKEEAIETINKALAKRAELVGKPVDELAEWEKLDTSNVRFKKLEAHYKEGVGYTLSRLGKDGPEADQVWKTMGDLKTYFTTVLLIYPSNREGELIKEELATGCKVVPWRLSGKTYETLHQRAESLRQNSLSIASQDLLLKCTNQEFHNFDIDAAGPAIWSKNQKFSSAILGKAYGLYEKLTPFREMSTADLKIKLGISTGSAGSNETVSDDDFNGLLDSV
jgi:hypothetical protein